MNDVNSEDVHGCQRNQSPNKVCKNQRTHCFWLQVEKSECTNNLAKVGVTEDNLHVEVIVHKLEEVKLRRQR